MGASTSHTPMGLHGLLQGQLCLIFYFSNPVVVAFKVFRWPSTQQLKNKTHIKGVYVLFVIYTSYKFRSKRWSWGGTHKWMLLYPSPLNYIKWLQFLFETCSIEAYVLQFCIHEMFMLCAWFTMIMFIFCSPLCILYLTYFGCCQREHIFH
jgi:sensor histidine kinase YesM